MITLRDLTTQHAASGTTLTVTIPATAQPGDWAILILQHATAPVTITAPSSDWTRNLALSASTTHNLTVYTFRIEPGWASEHAFTFSASAAHIAVLLLYAGADQNAPCDATGIQADASGATSATPAVTTTRTNDTLIAIWGANVGAPTITVPGSVAELANETESPLTLAVAQGAKGTPGSAPALTATLGTNSTTLAAQIALEHEMLNGPEEVRDEGNWSLAGWDPRITTEAGMDDFVSGLIQDQNIEVQTRAGQDFYTLYANQSPWNSLLRRVEMHLCQATLLEAAAQITESGSDNNPAPFLGTGATLLTNASRHRSQADTLLQRIPANTFNRGRPLAVVSLTTTRRLMERFDPNTGVDKDPFDDQDTPE